MSTLEATGTMAELAGATGRRPRHSRAGYAQAHVAYLADRASIEAVPEIDGISAGGMPTRVKCLHALAAHALAAGPGVNPIGDLALAETSLVDRRLRVRIGRLRQRAGAVRRALAAVAALGILASARRGDRSRHPRRPDPRPRVLAGRVRVLPGLEHHQGRGRDRRRDRHGHRQQPSGSGRQCRRRDRHLRAGRRQRAAAGGPQQGARHDGRLAHRRARPRRRRRNHRGRPGGRAAVGLGRLRRRHGRDRTTRSRTRCAGRSTTAPTSSTCR